MKQLTEQTISVIYPDCAEVLPVIVTIKIVTNKDWSHTLVISEPDMADLWLHAWSHHE